MRKIIDFFVRNQKLHNVFNYFFQTVNGFDINIIKREKVQTEENILLDDVKVALNEWKNAEIFFQNVTQPDLIDHAIYRMDAAKIRYIYLLKLSKEMNVKGIVGTLL